MEISLNEKFKKFAEINTINFVVLYGSRAKKQSSKESDYDIAILFKNPRKFNEKYTETLFALSNSLGIPEEKIDLTNLDTDNILLRYQITGGGKLLYGNPSLYAEFCAFAYREYHDADKLFALERLIIEKRQEYFKQILTNV